MAAELTFQFEKLGSVGIEGAESFPAGFVCQGAGQIGFAHAGGAGNDAVTVMADPVAGGQLLDGGALQPPRVAIVDVLQAGGLL